MIFRDGGRIRRYFEGEISTLIAVGDPRLPGFSAVSATAANSRGDVLIIAINGVRGLDLPSPGLFLLRNDAELATIALGHEHASGFGVLLGAKTFLDRSGNVLFLSDLNGSPASALFLFSPAGISQIVADDQQTPWGQLDFWNISSGTQPTFVVNAEPTVAFTSGIAEAGSYREGLFINSVSGLALVATTGDPAPGSEQGLFDSFTGLISLNDAGEMVFQASLRGSRFGWGLFAAGPSRLEIANGGFELPGLRSLPAGWETSWSNFGDTRAWVYDAKGKSSFLGNRRYCRFIPGVTRPLSGCGSVSRPQSKLTLTWMAFNDKARGYQPLRLHAMGTPPRTRASACETSRRPCGFASVQVMLKGGVMPPRSKALRAHPTSCAAGSDAASKIGRRWAPTAQPETRNWDGAKAIPSGSRDLPPSHPRTY